MKKTIGKLNKSIQNLQDILVRSGYTLCKICEGKGYYDVADFAGEDFESVQCVACEGSGVIASMPF